MAEGVFSIAADITPQLDDRELQRQATLMADRLNGIMGKQVNSIGFKTESGQFRPFQQELEKSRGLLNKFQDGLSGVPRSVNNIARSGRSAFLKITDALNITRREFVGFGKGIKDTIRDSNLFENALDGIREAGATISDLPESFEVLSAQVRSGVSYVDQMAQSGDRMAQMFQPIQQQGEAARTEFVEMNASIDTLTRAIGQLARASGGLDAATREVGKDPFALQIESARKLQDIVKGTPNLFDDIAGSIDKAMLSNSPEVLLKELLDIKNEAQKTTGPMGRIAQLINEKSGGRFFADNTRAARELAIELEQHTIAEIRKTFGPEALGAIENFNARLRETGTTIQNAVRGFNAFRTGLAGLLPGVSPIGLMAHSLSELGDNFRILRMDGVSTMDAIGGAVREALRQFKDNFATKNPELLNFIQRAKAEITGFGLLITQTRLGAKFNESLGSIGDFLNKNLIAPLRMGRQDLEKETAKLRENIVNGLSNGLKRGGSAVAKAASDIAHTTLEVLRNVFQTHSDAKTTIKMGHDLGSGLVRGVNDSRGAVSKAISSFGEGLNSLASQVRDFAKSVATVAGTALAGLGAVSLKTGADFNILKQVINASLPVIVGSKQAAAGLLEEVNKLNDSSPYARSSFLELTRVLAGFGVEAKKITPLIDAIQQTVAATGGSDQDLLELGQAFAKIQSQGRVTGEVLQSFSVRGIDAVGVLAAGFGTTTSKMRGMISDGLVPAGKAIDVLTKGLKEKFDGATEAVAKNFPGALQRVQARLRDIGGTLLTAFITPAGGGALVDFLNNMADLLSHINKQVLPAMAPMLQTVANALVTVSEKTEEWVKRLSGKEFGEFLNSLRPYLPILAGIAGLLPAAFGFIPVVGPIIAGLGGPFTAVAAAIAVFLAQTGHMDDALRGISGTFKGVRDTVSGAAEGMQDHLGGLALAFSGGSSMVTGFVGKIGGLVKFMTSAIPGVSKLGEVFAKFTSFISKGLEWIVKLVPSLAKLTTEGSKLSGGLKLLTGPFGTVAIIMAQLILTSQRFRDALVNLWDKAQPVVHLIGQVFAVAVEILDGALKALEPVFTAVVQVLGAVFNALKPVVDRVSEFLGFLQEHDVISKFFDGVKAAIESVIDTINTFIDILDKALGPFINLPEIELDVKTDPAQAAMKKAADEAKKEHERIAKAAKASSEAIEDSYNAASKAVETAQSNMGNATDSLLQAISTAAGVINGLISAAQSAKTASEAVTSAREKEAEATRSVSELQADYAKALRDVISPTDELGVAERSLTRIRKGLTDLTREENKLIEDNKKLNKELGDLQGEEANKDRAALARGEERAQIALNRAKQAEIDLLNELNPKEKTSLDLTGLSLDQIRAKLKAAQMTAAARKGSDREKTAQEIEDAKKSARLDVEDAEAALEDSKAAKAQFEIDTNEKINDIREQIRDNDERIKAIADDRADQLLDEKQQLQDINRLREGETTQQRLIKDWDDKIATAKEAQKTASKAVETATQNSAIAAAEFKLKTAEAKGDADGILAAQQALWDLQTRGSGLNFQAGALRDIMHDQMTKVQTARDAAKEMTDELARANKLLAAQQSLQSAGSSLASYENLGHSIDNNLATGNEVAAMKMFPKQDAAKAQLYASLRAALGAGLAEQKLKGQEPWLPNPAQIEAVIRKIEEIFNRIHNLRDAIAQGLNAFNLSMPGFAAAHGYAPGDYLQRGSNDGVGLMRWAEWGKEAVLPLTKKFDMARVVNNPAVLPKILDALPRWKRPESSGISGETLADEIASVVKTSGGNGPRNSDVYERKSQREFAAQIGAAVKTAVAEALAESDSLGGADVDINVMPSTGNERLIAREVRRQVNKALEERRRRGR